MNTRQNLLTLFGVISFLFITVVVYYSVVSSDNVAVANYDFYYHTTNVFTRSEASENEEHFTTVTEIAAGMKADDPTTVENTVTTQASEKRVTKVEKKTEDPTVKSTEAKKDSPTTQPNSKMADKKTKVSNTKATKARKGTPTAKASIKVTKSGKNTEDPTVKSTNTKNVKTTPTAIMPVTKATHKKFAICHSYWEQQTNAVLNMWSFQKWANKSGDFGVLEPFVHDSELGFSEKVINEHSFNASLRFRDYFNLDQWNKGTEKYKVPPLVNWREFVDHASRNIHLAVSVYSEPGGIFEGDDIKKNPGCVSEVQRYQIVLKKLLGFLGFKIEKVACYSFLKYYNTLKDFNSPFDPNSNATIYFTLWTGIGRIGIGDKALQRERESDILTTLLPSARILSDSRSYVKRVLNVDFQGYTAIGFRAVRRLQEMKASGFNHTDVIEHYYDCISQLPGILEQHGLKPFLATDLGRFGDQTNVNARSPEFMKMFQHLINMVYGNKTVSEYEEDFITAANGIADTGYIGTIQKAISLNAKCVIMIGGFSTFQDSLIAEFKQNGDCIIELCYGKPFPPKKTSSPPK